MNLARSTYYYQSKSRGRVLEKEKEDAKLKGLIDDIHTEFPYYGYRLLYEELKRRGHNVNTKRIRRLQRKFGLFPVRLRKFVRATDSRHSFKIYPNLLKESSPPCGINRVWVSDITYLRILTGFVYVAIIMDLYSKKVIGWAVSRNIDRRLTFGALRMVVERRGLRYRCIHHFDKRFIRKKPKRIIADKTYDSKKIRESFFRRGVDFIVPHRVNVKEKV